MTTQDPDRREALTLGLGLATLLAAAGTPGFVAAQTEPALRGEAGPLGTMRNDHVAVRVPNFEETIRWYSDKLGFREVVRWQAPAYVGGGLRLAYLQLNDILLEIAGDGTAPKPSRTAPTSIPELFEPSGWNHPCFRVDDMDQTIAELKRRGVEIYAGPNTNPTLKRVYLHIKDNNGFPIELVQYPKA